MTTVAVPEVPAVIVTVFTEYLSSAVPTEAAGISTPPSLLRERRVQADPFQTYLRPLALSSRSSPIYRPVGKPEELGVPQPSTIHAEPVQRYFSESAGSTRVSPTLRPLGRAIEKKKENKWDIYSICHLLPNTNKKSLGTTREIVLINFVRIA